MSRNRGELLKSEFIVTPGENNSFVIRMRDYGPGSIANVHGFTTIDDLLKFLDDEATAFKSANRPSPPAKKDPHK
jgi:hypothetical protein